MSQDFSLLPHETVLNIFRWLPYSTLAYVCPQVCKEWNNVASDNNLWRSLYVARWGSERGPLGEVFKAVDYALSGCASNDLNEGFLPALTTQNIPGSKTTTSPWRTRFMGRIEYYRDWSFGNYSITCYSPVTSTEENERRTIVALDFNKETRTVTAGDSKGNIFQWHEDGQFIRRVPIPPQYIPFTLMTIRGTEIAIACRLEPMVVIFRLNDNDSEPEVLEAYAMRDAVKENYWVSNILELRVTNYCVAVHQHAMPYSVIWNRKNRKFIRFGMSQRSEETYGIIIKELTPEDGRGEPTTALIRIVYAQPPAQKSKKGERNTALYVTPIYLDDMTMVTRQLKGSINMEYDYTTHIPNFNIWVSPFTSHALVLNHRIALGADLTEAEWGNTLARSSTEVVKAAAFLSDDNVMSVGNRGTITFSSLSRTRDIFRLSDFHSVAEEIECMAVCDDHDGRASKILLGTNNDIILIDSLKHNRDLQLRRFQETLKTLSTTSLVHHVSLQDYYDAAVYIVYRLHQLQEEMILIATPATVHELGSNIGERYSEELKQVRYISELVTKRPFSVGLPSIHPIVECCVRQLESLIGYEEWMCNTAISLFTEERSYMHYSNAAKTCAEYLNKAKGFEPTTSRLQLLGKKLKEQIANALNAMLQPFVNLVGETKEWIRKTDAKEFGEEKEEQKEKEQKEKEKENQKEGEDKILSNLPVIEKPERYWSSPSIVTAKQKLELLQMKQAYLREWLSDHQKSQSSAEEVKEELLARIQAAETANFIELTKGMLDVFKENYLAELFRIRDQLNEYKNSPTYSMVPLGPKAWIAVVLTKLDTLIKEKEGAYIEAEIYQIIEASCETMTQFRALQVYSRAHAIHKDYEDKLRAMKLRDLHNDLGSVVATLEGRYKLSKSDVLPNEMHVNVYKALDAFGLAEERIKEIKERKRNGTFSEADALQLVAIKQEIENLSWHAEQYLAIWKAIRDLDKIEEEGIIENSFGDDFDYYDDYNSDYGEDEESDCDNEEGEGSGEESDD